VGGLVFGQFDRILLGVTLGAATVAPYALCVQFAHPIFGLTASALHFLFPYLSSRAGDIQNPALKRTLLKAFACNLALVVCGACVLLLAGSHLLRIWAGAAVAARAAKIFPLIVLSSALAGLSVTGTYALQALGLFRTVALLSLSGKTVVLMLMFYLLRRMGLDGLAMARVCYGILALVVYLPIWRQLIATPTSTDVRTARPIPAGAIELQEGSQP
jgi:O-antigen/teichoic acid export membrane protein